MIVLSLFDGMSCGQIALDRAGIKVDKYYASEIDKYAMQITQKNYPDTIQLGDITRWKEWNIEKPDLVIGGSPCQGFSFAGKQLNFKDERSKLFFTFVDILNHYKPKYFLLENVKMKIDYERVITQYMNCYPVEINSTLVSAQNRRRLYWTNIGQSGTDLFGTIISGIKQPKDKGILLKDILQPESEVDEKYYIKNPKWLKYLKNSKTLTKMISKINGDKSLPLLARQYADWRGNFVMLSNYMGGYGEKKPRVHINKSVTLTTPAGGGHLPLIVAQRGRENGQQLEPNFTGKTNSLTTVEKDNYIGLASKIRRLTPRECARLQTIPEHIIDKMLSSGVSDSQLYKMLGNGWTVDVIKHIFKYIEIVK